MNGWMDDWMVFQATILLCKAILGLEQMSDVEECLDETRPRCKVNRSTSLSAAQVAITVLRLSHS